MNKITQALYKSLYLFEKGSMFEIKVLNKIK